MNTATIDTGLGCDGCPVARWRHQQTGDVVECVCGATYPSPARPTLVSAPPAADELVRRSPLAGPLPDARVSVATEEHLRPSATPVDPARTTRAEDAFVVRLRRLVVELRAVELDGAGAAAIVYRERVQTSGSSYEGPRIGAATVRRPVTDRLAALAAQHPREVAVLAWLRAWAPAYELLAAGRTSLLLAECARALGSEAQHIAWTLAPKGAEVWARAAVERAMGAWWGGGLDEVHRA